MQQQEEVEAEEVVVGLLQLLCTLAEVEVVVKTLDRVVEEAETGPYPRN